MYQLFFCIFMSLVFLNCKTPASTVLTDYKIEQNAVAPDAVDQLVAELEVIKKNSRGDVPLKVLFDVFGLTEKQISEIGDKLGGESLSAACFDNELGEHLYCEMSGVLSSSFSLYLKQMKSPIYLKFAKEIKLRTRVLGGPKGVEFCNVEGLAAGPYLTADVNGAIFEMPDEDTVNGFLDVGNGGTYAEGAEGSKACVEGGVPATNPEQSTFVTSKGCSEVMAFSEYTDWERAYGECKGAVLCLNTKKADECIEGSNRIRFDCVVGVGLLRSEIRQDLSREEINSVRSELSANLREKSGIKSCCNSGSKNSPDNNMYSATATTVPKECF